ncbi:MAG: PAS domain-containing protein, partial [Chloroflexales bacterium]
MDNQQLSTLILDALDDHAALLTADGTIVQVNLAWRRFAQANGDCDLHTTGPGVNYLEVCRRAAQTGDALAHAVFAGLQAVLMGQQASFQLEYPCHTPLEPRRFTLRAVPLAPNDRRVLVTHRPITVYKEAMIADAALIVLFAQAETWLRLQSAALEATATPVAIIDHTGMIKWVNPAYTQMTGYLASEVLG